MSINIDAEFIKQEILNGSIGTRLTNSLRDSIDQMPDEQIDALIDEVYENTKHPIHGALDSLVRSIAELQRRNLRRTADQTKVLEELKPIMPNVPMEIVANAITLGSLRKDELAPMAILWNEEDLGCIEFIAPDPHGPQRNLTDQTLLLAGHDALQIALNARYFYLTEVDPAAGVKRLVTVTGDAYKEAVDAINDLGGSTSAAVEYLLGRVEWSTQSLVNDHLLLDSLREAPHQLHGVISSGIDYYLHINHQEHLYTLYVALTTEHPQDKDHPHA